tara:strand:+ start:407 stop:886 length:480 start_codon:yes stop_codon:yes gene_type:complete
MENEDYRNFNFNGVDVKCYRDGRIETMWIDKKGFEKWKLRTSNNNTNGYTQIYIGNKKFMKHRLIMYAYKGISDLFVDHLNGDRNDNRFDNLKYVTHQENMMNMDRVKNAKNYYWNKSRNKWMSYITINGKNKYLGCFEKEEDAKQSVIDAKNNYTFKK